MSQNFQFLPYSLKLGSVNYQQKELIKKLENYLGARSKKNPHHITTSGRKLPYESHAGLCAGLVAYWLYCKRLNKESEFIDSLEYISKWRADTFLKSDAKGEPLIEEFLNAIELLNFNNRIMPEISQRDFHASFALLTDKKENQIAEPEFKITFAFNAVMLENLFLVVVMENKMIRLGNGEHAVGLMRNGDSYTYYNPENKNGPQTFNSISKLSATVFQDFKQFSNSIDYLALNIIAYDLELTNNREAKYPSAIQYCTRLLKDPEYKKAIFNNKDILELALICKDSEVIEILINKGCLEFKDADNRSALSVAIIYKSSEIVYALLMAGADLSSAPIPSLRANLWQLALLDKNIQVMIMLLAFGLELTADDVKVAKHIYPQSLKNIAEHAVALNLKLLNLPDGLNLDNATGNEVIAFLRNAKVRLQCGADLENITIQRRNKTVTGLSAIELIVRYYQKNTSDSIASFIEQTEIYKLLKFFKTEYLDLKVSDDLLVLVKKIGKKITSKSMREYTAADHVEVEKIIAELHDLSKKSMSTSITSLIFKNDVSQILSDIKRHLKKGDELNNNAKYHPGHLFFSSTTKVTTQEQPKFSKIAPMLSLRT